MRPRAFGPVRLNVQTRTPNAGPELRLEAGARHERTLDAVGSNSP
jgi:hypothetical protein